MSLHFLSRFQVIYQGYHGGLSVKDDELDYKDAMVAVNNTSFEM